MKTKNLFKTFVAAALCATFSFSANAQLTTTGTATQAKNAPNPPPSASATEVVDYATIGSKMPYSITPDPTVAAQVDGTNFLASGFSWRISGAGGSFEQVAAHNPLTVVGAYVPTAYAENNVAVLWGNTAGDYTITVAEQSRNTLGLTQCVGADSTLHVYLMPKPTAQFIEAGTLSGVTDITGTAGDAIVGGCGVAGTTIHFNVTFTGTEKFDLAYQYVYTPFTTGIPGAPVPLTANNLGATNYFTATPALPNTAAVTNAFTFNVPAGNYGKYVFTLTSVTDLVSRKSLSTPTQDPGVLDNTTGALAATLTLFSLPTPTTGTIKHVTNLGW